MQSLWTESRMDRERVLILGAAGRDFHDFNVFFRDNWAYEVVGFTAAQIPAISWRSYPPHLSGPLYPAGLPIWPEEDLEKIIRDNQVDRCILAYSDLSHLAVMEIASRALTAGADFGFLGKRTMLSSTKPVVAVCAVRTGAGKSPASRYAVEFLKSLCSVVVVRHPMPYGNLEAEEVQRFASFSDLDAAGLTLEEREEYEGHLRRGTVVYAGVDYRSILSQAEKEADLIVWDGGNNDLPFFKPDLWITLADALRPGHETQYYPGEINFRSADVIVINKANAAPPEAVRAIKANAALINPRAQVVEMASQVMADRPELIKGKRVLIIEDGPSITHGGMPFGAGKVAAERFGASEIVDPRPFAAGSIKEALEKYSHIGAVLPAVGYYPHQIKDLEETVNKADCDSVVIATPIDLRHLIKINKPSASVSYELADIDPPYLRDILKEFHSGSRG
jgi:predicted GTPase